MSADDNEKIPEEVWAAEMAEENYNPQEEENYGDEVVQHKQTQVTKKNKRIEKTKSESDKQKTPPTEQQTAEAVEQRQIEELAKMLPPHPPEEHEFGNQAKGKIQGFVPMAEQEAKNQPKDNQIVDEPLDVFEQELQLLAQHIGQPIDELEPGFPQFNNFMKHQIPNQPPDEDEEQLAWVPELGKAEEKTIPPNLPLFPILQTAHKKAMEIPLAMNPRVLRQAYEARPFEEQAIFMEALRRAFPPKNIEPKNNNEKNKVFQFDDEDDIPDQKDDIIHTIEAEEFLTPGMIWFNPEHVDDETIKEDLYISRRFGEEEAEYAESVRQEVFNQKKPRGKSDLLNALKRGLEKHNEDTEMQNINRLIDGKPIEKPKTKTFHGRANIQDLNEDELRILFKRFTFEGQLMLSLASPLWQHLIFSTFAKQTYLWFSNEEKSLKRYLPIEVCCQTCIKKIDTEPVIRVVKNFFLVRIIDEILSQTTNLKCLRLLRFEFSRTLIVRKLKENCPRITHLDLTECYDFKFDVIKELATSYPQMKHLLLSSTNLNEQMLRCLLQRMKNLETLDVSATLIDGTSLELLPMSIKRLDIRCCPKVSERNLIHAIKKKPIRHWQHLKIDAIANRDLFQEISNKVNQHLIVLEVSEFENMVLSVSEFLQPVQNMTKLQSLKFGRNISINNHLLTILMTSCKDIRSFSIEFSDYGERRLSDENLSRIANEWKNIERLEVINCVAVQRTFSESLTKMSNLTYLNLTQCTRLSDEYLAPALKNMSADCTYIVLDNCHNLGKGTLDAIVIKAMRMENSILRTSMLRCNFQNLPYLKSKLLPQNLRISYSSTNAKRYVTFDGKRTKWGRMTQLINYLKDD